MFKKKLKKLKSLTKSLKVHPYQAVLRREKSPQLQHQKLRSKLSNRCWFSPNSIHNCLFLTKPCLLTLCKPLILIFLLQTEEEYIVEIILDDVVDRLVTNVISLVTKHSNFGRGFKDKEELKNLFYTLWKIHVMLRDAQKRQMMSLWGSG